MTDEPTPLLRVVRGVPAPDELAALVTVVATRLATAATPEGRPARPAWGDPAAAMTPMPRPGPDAWQRSTRATGIRTGAGW